MDTKNNNIKTLKGTGYEKLNDPKFIEAKGKIDPKNI